MISRSSFEPGDPGEAVLEALEDTELLEKRQHCGELMVSEGRWFRDSGEEIFPPWNIALGRHEWYRPFADRLGRESGTESYLLDFLVWPDLRDPQVSLLWFISRAARIDISLKGISAADLFTATTGAGERKPSRRALGLPFMTSWEINQVYWGGFLDRTWWHTGPAMTQELVFETLGGLVGRERIIEDPEESP